VRPAHRRRALAGRQGSIGARRWHWARDSRRFTLSATISNFVAGLTAGLDTVLGERGTLISGGERQRLCLARAVLRRPFLFVLDEATSAIDVPAERKIIKTMLDLKPRPTIVMIAHRDQSLASCDRLLRLQNGGAIADEPALTG
jgi:ABC-type bacteriocin/lantibiotic exporter with double-glycine peptidase domain